MRYQVQAARIELDIRGSGEELAIKTKMTARIATTTIEPQSLARMREHRVLVFGTQVRGFAPGRSRRILRAKKSSVGLLSEGK